MAQQPTSPAPKGSSGSVTREQLVAGLQQDLAREYKAIIQYVIFSQKLDTARFQNIAGELEKHAHEELEAWAEWASIPVINALTADEHPCPALADALTIRDRLGAKRQLMMAAHPDRPSARCSRTLSAPPPPLRSRAPPARD